MILIHLTQHLMEQANPWLADLSSWTGVQDGWLSHPIHHWTHYEWNTLAQQFDRDVFRGVRTAFNNFVRSGQVWALLIGMVIGYVVRGLTSYG